MISRSRPGRDSLQRAFLDMGLLDAAIASLLYAASQAATQGWKPNGCHFSQLGQNRMTVILGFPLLVTSLPPCHVDGANRRSVGNSPLLSGALRTFSGWLAVSKN